jgi:hypothetical protein
MLLNNRNLPADAKRYAWQCVAFSLSLILILGGYKFPQAIAPSKHRQQITKFLRIGAPIKYQILHI